MISCLLAHSDQSLD